MAPHCDPKKSKAHRAVNFLCAVAILSLCALFATHQQKVIRSQAAVQAAAPEATAGVTEEEVFALLDDWAAGIVEIGKAKLFGEDYRAKAADFIDRVYAYGTFPVMFKPSRAAKRPFRPTREGALSYFVGGNRGFPEDTGFALMPWKEVRFDIASISINQDSAVAMGAYYFVDLSEKETKAEFTFGVRPSASGRLRIILHHSSLPYPGVAPATPKGQEVTTEEVRAALRSWGDAIVEIGKVKLEGGDYTQTCATMVDQLYSYDVYPVVLKPTDGGEQEYRSTFKGAMSYFAGGDPEYPEDTGFAINPWKGVRFEIAKVSLHESSAIAVGSYYFTDMEGQVTKADFTFGYRHDGEGKLRIILHQSSLPEATALVTPAPTRGQVTQQAVLGKLKEWGDSIVEIGKLYRSPWDARQKAASMIDSLYAYDVFPVLFKPTQAKEQPFRATREGALSYYVGGNPDFPEDSGFALQQWRQVVLEPSELSTHENSAMVMGTYKFTDMAGDVTAAEFTIGFRVDDAGKLRIVLHHSSLPFETPADSKPQFGDVTEDEVMRTLKDWTDSVVNIGKVFQEEGDYKQTAADMVDRLYAYDVSPVLFKPTRAAWHPFRPTREGAISYFVGGNHNFPEDTGFALEPWKAVHFHTTKVSLHESGALAMGNCEFHGMNGQILLAQFTFGFRHDGAGNLRIVLHHFSTPYGSD